MQPWPADAVERRAVSGLVPYARNARMHSEAQVAQIAGSIQEWGWTIPVLCDENGGIIAGHGRVLAALKLGLTEVPVMVARGWSEAQKRAYVIADNKLAMNADWDEDLLRCEIADLIADDFNMDLIGFDPAEIAGLMIDAEGLTDVDDTPEVQEQAVARVGEVWALGAHRLACGDCTDPAIVAAVLEGSSPHLMVTDPPYGVEYDADWRNHALRADGSKIGGRAVGKVTNDETADWRAAWALFPGEVAYVWHAGNKAQVVAEGLESEGFEIRAQIIWGKNQLVIGRGHYHPQHEPCWYAVRKRATGHWVGDRKQTTLWLIDKPQKSETGHSTQKPVECMRRPVVNNSKPGERVYEPFSGSFTTGIACQVAGRICHAIEVEPLYVDVGIRRWEAFTGQAATLLGDGRTFTEIAQERVDDSTRTDAQAEQASAA